MSYRGEVAYQQERSPTGRGRGGYYNNGGNNSYENQQDSRPYHDQHSERDTRGDRRQLSNNSYRDEPQQTGYQRPTNDQYNQSQEMNRYSDRDNVASHRYPETFQNAVQPPRDQNQVAMQPPPNWGNEQRYDTSINTDRFNQQEYGGRSQPTKSQSRSSNPPSILCEQSFDNRRQYQSNQPQQQPPYQRNDNQLSNRNQQVNFPREADDRSFSSRNENLNNRNEQFRIPDAEKNMDRYNSEGYLRQPEVSSRHPPPENTYQPADTDFHQRNQAVSIPQNIENYRDNNFAGYQKPNIKHPQEPPQILAKTSGNTAVFGIVARVGASSINQAPPLTSPTRSNIPTQPLSSPTRNYSNDHYQDRGPVHKDSNQNQHGLPQPPIQSQHHPTPSLSPRSRSQDQNWQRTNIETRDQYKPSSDSNQLHWNQSQNDRSYQSQHNTSHSRPPYIKNDASMYNDGQGQYDDRAQPQHTNRPIYREHDNTESSGYGSESTYHTERSYGEQRFPDKSHDLHNMKPILQQPDSRIRSPVESYSRSPPSQYDSFQDQYKNNQARSPPIAALEQHGTNQENRYDGGYRGTIENGRPQDSFGSAVTFRNPPQNRYKTNQPPPVQYEGIDYDRRVGPPNQMPNYGPHSDMISNPGRNNLNPGSGVEETHLKSVRNAKNIFEEQSDPKRPPPAPKPLVAPKPHMGGNVNTRPIPPRPKNISEADWSQQGIRNEFSNSSPGSPPYTRTQHDDTSQRFQPQSHPSHSQSMNHLDEMSRHQDLGPPGPGNMNQRNLHAKSMQNLDDRYPREDNYQQPRSPQPFQDERPNEGYRNSYSGTATERPMVLGVKYNQDSAPPVQINQHSQSNWDRPPQHDTHEVTPHSSNQPQTNYTATRPYNDRNSWSNEPTSNQQQSYSNRNAAPRQSNYGRPRGESDENENYVPDVVARSYDLARQTQETPPDQQSTQNYTNPSSDTNRNIAGNRPRLNNGDRWPTPPPPIANAQPYPPPVVHDPTVTHPMVNDRPQQSNNYNDDWRRPGGPEQTGPPTTRHKEHTVRFDPKPQEYFDDKTPDLRLPPPPQQPYSYDSESSEVDVDAPTPPPSSTRSKPHFINDNGVHSVSQYERNKPVPILNREPDSWGRGDQQQHVKEEPNQSFGSRFPQKGQQDLSQSYQIKSQPIRNDQFSGSGRTNLAQKPQKPQRNSVHLNSPEPTNDVRSPSQHVQNTFDFDVRETQPLTYPSSRERQRLGKSGALANRKPPTRAGSTSNLAEGNDECEIEVTDSELSQKASSIVVHREESMRILRAKKDKESSSDTASSILERSTKQRASQRTVLPPDDDKELRPKTKSGAYVKKPDSKLVYKLPSAEAAKTIPMPLVTEPAAQASKRPPTYTGFGETSEKPKTDLLSQFKTARNSALRTAAEKQDKAFKSVSALVKFSHGKKEPKSPPKPKLTAAERNAKVLDKMNVEVKPNTHEEEKHHSRHSHSHGDDGSKLGSTRSSSTIKADKYDGDDDDNTNVSRHERDRRGRGRDRQHDEGRGKSRARSSSRGRDISPENRSRRRSPSRERSISPDGRHRPRREYDDRRRDERRRHDDPPYHKRPPSPTRHRYPPPGSKYHPRPTAHRQYPQPYDGHRATTTREPDWVEKYRRGKDGDPQPRRAWVNDPRRVEVTAGGRRRELDIDAFENEVKRATSYNSDFEQPESRHQMIPTKLTARKPPNSKRQPPPGDWMNALKEKNKNAAKTRMK